MNVARPSAAERIDQARLEFFVSRRGVCQYVSRKKAPAIGVKAPYLGFVEILLAEMVERVPYHLQMKLSKPFVVGDALYRFEQNRPSTRLEPGNTGLVSFATASSVKQ